MTEPKNIAAPSCEASEVHPDSIARARKALPAEADLNRLAELYKVFGDATRIKLLYALFQSELCVCDLAELLGVTVSAVSHQLRILKQAQLVKYRREGKTVYYSLADDHVRTIIDQGNEHIHE